MNAIIFVERLNKSMKRTDLSMKLVFLMRSLDCANLYLYKDEWLFPGRWRRDLVKRPSSTVQAGSVSTLRNSAMANPTVETTVMRISTGSSKHDFQDSIVDLQR